MNPNSHTAQFEANLTRETRMLSSDVERDDLSSICSAMQEEFTHAAGQTIAITGAAGFLGYYRLFFGCYQQRQRTTTCEHIRCGLHHSRSIDSFSHILS